MIAAAGVGGEGGGPDLPRVNQQVDASGAPGFFQAPHQCQTLLSGLRPEGTRLTAATASVRIFPRGLCVLSSPPSQLASGQLLPGDLLSGVTYNMFERKCSFHFLPLLPTTAHFHFNRDCFLFEHHISEASALKTSWKCRLELSFPRTFLLPLPTSQWAGLFLTFAPLKRRA